MASELTNWAVFINEHFYDRPTFAAILVRRTAKRVVFIRRPECEDAREEARKADCLVVDGLTEAQAKHAVEMDRSSLALSNAEIKASKQRHAARRAKTLSALAPTQGDDHGPA